MKKRREACVAYLFLLPSLTGLLVFFLLPFAGTIRRSFYDTRRVAFVGLQSYASVLDNAAFRLAGANTVRFIAVCIPLLLVLSLVLALLLRAIRPRGRRLKTTYLVPMAIPVASMVLLWQALFHQNGLINAGLLALGAAPVGFMESDAAFWVLILTYIWKNSGYHMILWLAGLDGIAESQYEAARVDGADGWRCFWHITLPSLRPTLGLAATLALLNSFKVFREAYLVAGPRPHQSIYLLQHLFNNWFQQLDLSRLCAAAALLAAALLAPIALIQRFLVQTND